MGINPLKATYLFKQRFNAKFTSSLLKTATERKRSYMSATGIGAVINFPYQLFLMFNVSGLRYFVSLKCY